MELFAATTAALTALIAVALPLSVAVTKIVDFIRNLFDASGTAPHWLWNVVAFAVGLAVALGWDVNLVGAIVRSVPALSDSSLGTGVGGTILTGLVLGGMAGFWHDKMAQWSAAHGNVSS